MVGRENAGYILALFLCLKKSITSKILRLSLRLALSLVPIPFQNVILSSKHKNEQSLRGRVDIHLKRVSIYIRPLLVLMKQTKQRGRYACRRKGGKQVYDPLFTRHHYITQEVETQVDFLNPPSNAINPKFPCRQSPL